MRAVVAIDDDVTVRTAHVLAAMGDIEKVSVMGPPRSKVFPVVKDAVGADVVVGETGREAAVAAGLPLVTEKIRDGGVGGCCPQGLALALSHRVVAPSMIAVAAGDAPMSGDTERVRFPDPVGTQDVSTTEMASHFLHVGPAQGDWSAVLVEGERALSIVDDSKFVAAITLACGVVLADRAPTMVWDHPEDYISACRDQGLVFAERD